MDGTVEVKSEAGRGSTFSVEVALRADSHTRRPGASRRPELDGVRILIVDDNETNRLILREMLAASGR